MRNCGILKKMTVLCVFLGMALSVGGCAQKDEEETLVVVESSDDTLPFEFVIAQLGDVTLTQKLRCTYAQQNDEPISFAMSGRLVHDVFVKEGDLVKKGDVLAELSDDNLERRIEDLEYQIARNELRLEYVDANEALETSQMWVNYIYNHMYNEESAAKAAASIQKNYRYQREDLNDALEMDRQALANMKAELQNCRVYAGMDGMVYKMKENLKNSTSREDEVIMTIVDNTHCLFETEAPEFKQYFKEGQTVSMRINVGSALGDYELLPYNIAEWGDKQQFSISDGPMTSGIEVGTGGTIQFVLDERKQVLCLPTTVVNNADDKYYVYVVDENDMRQIRWVVIGLIGDDTVEIKNGLTEGEKVIRR